MNVSTSMCLARVIVSTWLVAGCGQSASQSGDGDSATDAAVTNAYSMTVQSAANLPACDAASNGRLAYVQDTQSFQACSATGWAAIDIKGAQGVAGVAGTAGEAGGTGADGKAGADGKDGSDNHIDASIFCSGQLGTDDFFFSYSVAKMASGDIFSSGDVAGPSFQVSSTAFFSGQQVGAATAPIYMTMDSAVDANYGYWKISLDRESLVSTIEYNDLDVGVDPLVWTQDPEDCVVNAYD